MTLANTKCCNSIKLACRVPHLRNLQPSAKKHLVCHLNIIFLALHVLSVKQISDESWGGLQKSIQETVCFIIEKTQCSRNYTRTTNREVDFSNSTSSPAGNVCFWKIKRPVKYHLAFPFSWKSYVCGP